MSGPATVGWCPGALRPMASGDGLLMRVKPRGGRLTLEQAAAIASLAARFGNGLLDLTGRANLQIRGVRPETLEPLTAGLRDVGLLDGDVATESLRNIVVSPLAGLDATAYDIRPLQAAFEECFAAEPDLHVLPAKWSVVLDGGGRLPLSGVAGDLTIRFEAGGALHIGLGTSWSERLAAMPDVSRMLKAIATLVAAQPDPCRMPVLLERLGAARVFTDLGLPLAAVPPAAPPPVSAADLFAPAPSCIAFASPFGGLPAESLGMAAEACRDCGAGDLRLTPWRVLIATGLSEISSASAELARLGFILDPDDPRLKLSACVGAPACHRGETPARADAGLIASQLGAALVGPVHVSACAKGCARPSDAAWTLVAHDGRYDILHGRDPAPCVTGLSSTEAANWLSRAGGARIL